MATKKRGLGRGLDALLSPAKSSRLEGEEKISQVHELKELPLEMIERGRYQPRLDMDADGLESLANSIKAQGIVQPIVVRPIASGRYEIIAGERRWRAAQLINLQAIPAIIRDVADSAAVAMALIENIQREELNPIEEGQALQRLIDEFEMTHLQAAEAVGRSRAAVTNLLRLLTLSEEVKRLVSHGDLEMGHARALLTLSKISQASAAKMVVSKGLSVRDTERLVRRLLIEVSDEEKSLKFQDPDVKKLQDDLAEKLGASVKIKHGAKGKGKLEIVYNSLDELDGILAHIK